MAEFFDQSLQALRRFYEVVVEALSGVSLDPATWGRDVYLVLAGLLLLLVLLIAWRWRRRKRASGPQFLLTNGVVALVGEHAAAAEADGGPRRPAHLVAPPAADMQLRVTFNNLNPYPVQLLEVALTTGGGRLPVVADASAVVPPNGAVDVVADVSDLPGERGTLQVFVFVTKGARRNLRVTVPIEWEPWNLRYRVKATQQRVEAARGTASEQVTRVQRAAARRAALRERLSSAGSALRRRVEGAWGALAERRRAAELARLRAERERREALEVAKRTLVEEPRGPFAVPLPARRRSGPEPDPGAEGAGDSRPPEAVAVSEPRVEEPAEEKPKQRLEFPDEF